MYKLIGDGECYSKMKAAKYGSDAYGNAVDAGPNHYILDRNSELKEGDSPFDVYSGWLLPSYRSPSYHHYASGGGRWTAWRRSLPINGEEA